MSSYLLHVSNNRHCGLPACPDLARINGDLGRLGGLLKLWLTNDARVAQFGESTIRAVLSRIEDTAEEMSRVMLRGREVIY